VADKFRVGQKVRVIRAKNCPELLHQVFTIISPKERCYAPEFGEWDGYELDVMVSGCGISAEEDDLEPVYDGDEKSSWSECAWKPEVLQPSVPQQ
jgi:hypothetical protein